MDFVKICRRALYFRGSFSVCPAYAGMIPVEALELEGLTGLSRVCGDDPFATALLVASELFVPRMRG